MTSPFVLAVYDKDYNPQDWVGSPLRLEVTARFNAADSLTLTVENDDEQVGVLTAPGSRLTCHYRHDPTDPLNPKYLTSGAFVERRGSGALAGVREFELLSDFAYVMGIAGWPNPAGDASEQGDEEAYYTVSGPAETVVKTLVSVNATRLGMPVTCAPDLGRGADIEVSVRFHPLADRLFPAVTQAGIGVTVRQVGAGLVVDCYEPNVLTDALTEASGVVVGGSFTVTAPTITRVVALGGGVGVDRAVIDVVDADLENDWGMVLEARVDARDTVDPAVMASRAAAKLAEGAPRASVSAELAETDDFRCFVTVNLGDSVPILMVDAPPITDTVTEATLTYDADDGLLVKPRVGAALTTYDQITAAAIEAVAARTRDQDVRS